MGIFKDDDTGFPWSRTPVYKFQKGQTNDSIDDPTYLGFIFFFYFNGSSGSSDDVNISPLLGDEYTEGTALNYLKRNKEFVRMAYLKQFINLLLKINREMPWYWQSFTGGENFVKYNNFEDPYLGGEDSKVTIDCLEAIDLKMTALMDLYRNAVYDLEHRRIILPSNLRKFAIDIHIQEVRKFHISNLDQLKNVANKINTKIKSIGGDDIDSTEPKNENTPTLNFKLRLCEFLPDDSNLPFAEVDMKHGTGEFAKQKISFSYETLTVKNNYPNIDGGFIIDGTTVNAVASNDPLTNKEKFIQAAKDLGGKIIDNTVEAALSAAKNLASAELSKLLLGNVYGLNPATGISSIQSALNSGSVLSLGPQLISTSAAAGSPVKPPEWLGNVY